MKRIKLTKNDVDMLDQMRCLEVLPAEWKDRMNKIIAMSVGYGYETKEAER